MGVAAAGLILPTPAHQWGKGYPDRPGFAAVMGESLWVIWQVFGAMMVAAVLETGSSLAGRLAPQTRLIWAARVRRALRVTALCGMAFLCGRLALDAWAVTESNADRSDVYELAGEINKLPPRAVLAFVGRRWNDHLLAMFLSDRTCYRLED